MDSSDLDAALIAAHDRSDHQELVTLYSRAADLAEATGDGDAMCFYLTQAYVFALESGAQEADVIHARLKAKGREE